MTHGSSSVRRCAVYTRKSSEEGLEQDFNSLHAQREACEAFTMSQSGEGWHLIRTHYDDGGISGATMERPALRRLLEDIQKKLVDVVVVYKVDRLTRSLADFAKMVELFDAHSVSFVAVTQQFNTTTSMGRLTLNVLLSFAQFEREVTGERIRDKIAASKARGIWMGGTTPLGYDVVDRKLIINQPEAETVKAIYHRYLELGASVCCSRNSLAAASPPRCESQNRVFAPAAVHSLAERSTSCSRTRSTWARSDTRRRTIPVSMKPFSSANCGIRCRSTFVIRPFAARSRGPKRLRVHSQASSSTKTTSRSTPAAPPRKDAATATMSRGSWSGVPPRKRRLDGGWPGRNSNETSRRRSG